MKLFNSKTGTDFLISKSAKHRLILVIAALVLNLYHVSFHTNKLFFSGLLRQHGEVGYNLFKYNSIKVNKRRMAAIAQREKLENRLINYAEIDHDQYGMPEEYHSINDTVGYGIVLGLLWKVTGSLRYRDVQILQIILFCIAMIYFYRIGQLLFANDTLALYSSGALLFFLPIVFLNVQVLRDVWGFYGIIILLFCFLSCIKKNMLSKAYLSFGGVLFACTQWIRPSIFFTFLLLFILSLFVSKYRRVLRAWRLIFVITNVVVFWVPFMVYNKMAYGVLFVSPAGQDLYEGLGEFPNAYGLTMDDEKFSNMMQQRYRLKHGTVACDQKAKELFWQIVTNDPIFYLTTLLKRIPTVIFFNPLWTSGLDNFAKNCGTKRDFLILLIEEPYLMIMKIVDFIIARYFYIQIYLIMAWLGFFLMLFKNYREQALIIIAIVVSSLSKFPSHMEPRYLITHYWVFAYCVGYFVYEVKNLSKHILLRKHKETLHKKLYKL